MTLEFTETRLSRIRKASSISVLASWRILRTSLSDSALILSKNVSAILENKNRLRHEYFNAQCSVAIVVTGSGR